MEATDGIVLAVGTQDGRVQLADPATGETLLALQVQRTAVLSLIFSPDGSKFATAGDKSWRLWDVWDGTERLCVQGHTGTGACICESNLLRTWATVHVGCPVVGHARRVLVMAFSPAGDRVATGGQDEAVVVWDAETGQALLRLLEHHTHSLCAVAFSTDDLQLASASVDERVCVWDATNGAVLHILATCPAPLRLLQFSHDAQQLRCVSSRTDGLLNSIFQLDGGGAVEEFTYSMTGGPTALALSPDGGFTAGAASLGSRWTDVGVVVRSSEIPASRQTTGVQCVNIPGHWSGARPGMEGVHDKGAAGCICTRGHPNPECANAGHCARVTTVTFSLDGETLASGSADTTIKQWDAATGRLIRSFEIGASVSTATFGPNWGRSERRRVAQLAFAMGGHPRLGVGCAIGVLNLDLMRKLLERI